LGEALTAETVLPENGFAAFEEHDGRDDFDIERVA
jgi:hypothetical protein